MQCIKGLFQQEWQRGGSSRQALIDKSECRIFIGNSFKFSDKKLAENLVWIILVEIGRIMTIQQQYDTAGIKGHCLYIIIL